MSYDNRFKNNNFNNQNPVNNFFTPNTGNVNSFQPSNLNSSYNNVKSGYNGTYNNSESGYSNYPPQQSVGNSFDQPNDIKQASVYNSINSFPNNSRSEFDIITMKKSYLSALEEGDFDVDSFLGSRKKAKSKNSNKAIYVSSSLKNQAKNNEDEIKNTKKQISYNESYDEDEYDDDDDDDGDDDDDNENMISASKSKFEADDDDYDIFGDEEDDKPKKKKIT
jgi:hypothetical protein